MWRALPALLLIACVQSPPETAAPVPPAPVRSRRASRYEVEAVSQMAGFTLMVNGAVLASADGGKGHRSRTEINDWMVSGNNEFAVDLFWPEGVRASPGSTASFGLFANDLLIKEFRWPLEGRPDTLAAEPHTFRDTFRAEGFPRVQLEKAERVISIAGALSREDQQEIAALAEELRRALTDKNVEGVEALFKTKFTDLALARFTSASSLRTEASAAFRELMARDAYTVRPLSGRYSYAAVADGRAVRLTQGRVGFPEPALVVSFREGGRTLRHDVDLYFAKIDGKWLIIR